MFMDMETAMCYSHFNKRRCYECNAIQNHPGNFEAKRESYVAVSASVIIWVPKSGESKSGQMVSEKVIWS